MPWKPWKLCKKFYTDYIRYDTFVCMYIFTLRKYCMYMWYAEGIRSDLHINVRMFVCVCHLQVYVAKIYLGMYEITVIITTNPNKLWWDTNQMVLDFKPISKRSRPTDRPTNKTTKQPCYQSKCINSFIARYCWWWWWCCCCCCYYCIFHI